MKRIISVSRRTDIPAFYGDWFMRRLKEGFAGVVNPFSGQKYIVSLKQEDVIAFVFWSKNFTPFLENLRIIDRLGFKFYFNYTVTALPPVFESNLDKEAAIAALKQLSRGYSPLHINWRFDPIIISDVYSRDFYIRSFEKLASEFEGVVKRCYFSFVVEYDKVKRNFAELARQEGVKIIDCSDDFKIELANELAEIARKYGIEMFSCCGDYLVGGKIKKAHCIDGSIIERLFPSCSFPYSDKPTRKQCGCTESTDIGAYDTCPHGCIYCYANANKQKALEAAAGHDIDSAFLGVSMPESDRWIAEIKMQTTNKSSLAKSLKI
ncbi:MAG: DUF1848 domain-containing protein [Sedimentisphaerales bacterium]|nr:DUF1848 domain-containing protein [Sedimentisphaerales bacterium]